MSSTSMDDRKTQALKMKKMNNTKKEPASLLTLPHDLVLSCLARVSRLYYPILSLVSKSFRSLLASPELYKVRSLLNCTESCLYVCLQFPPDPNTHWFILFKKPNQTLTLTKNKEENEKHKEKSSGYVLVPIRILNSPPVEWTNLVAVGYNLYAITEESPPCSNVSFLDCRTHTWLDAPCMRISFANTVHNGKMYLPGNYENPDSLNCIEVFNTKTQTWKPVPPEKRIFKLRNLQGKIYKDLSKKKGLAINPKERKGEMVGFNIKSDNCCIVDNINYLYNYSREFEWCQLKSADLIWRKVQGLEGLPKFPGDCNVQLVGYGSKIVVMWDEDLPAFEFKEKEKMIWCAEISLEWRNNGEELWGKVEWFDAVLTVPKSYRPVYAIAATL